MGLGRKILTGGAVMLCTGAAYVVWDIAKKRKSDTHTYRSLLDQYLSYRVFSIVGRHMRRKLERDCENVAAVQEEVLLQRLREHADTAYGRTYRFADVTSREDYRGSHPLTRYEHYREYVERMIAGEEMVLTAFKPIVFGTTSGTSGKYSIIPMGQKQRVNFFLQGVTVALSSMLEGFPESDNLQKDLKIFHMPHFKESAAGIPIGPNSSSPANSQAMLNLYSTPKPGFDIMSEREALYVHLLFALKDRNLGIIEANFSFRVHTALVMMEACWEQLVTDIEKGCVDPNLNIEDDIRAALNQLLKPDLGRAQELREEFQKGFDGIVRRVWPFMGLILATDTGSFDLYRQKLKSHYGKGIPMYSPIYGATEGLVGVNIWPSDEERHYILCPRSMVFELIPVDSSDQDQPDTLWLEQAQLGGVYELVITNAGGLYRYRFGDVVKVVGFYHKCPVIQFMYRQGQMLNVRGEKTSEDMFYQALKSAKTSWADTGVHVVDYCCAESVLVQEGQADPLPHYVLFLELQNGVKGQEKQYAQQLEDCLRTTAYMYDRCRTQGSIGPLVVHLMPEGCFSEYREHLLSNTMAGSNQLKVPRVMKRRTDVDFMMDRLKE
ncbi:GHDC [Branchiostoma lanceolatum]|uniref:GHDC protein n=1 Tax=Branchiostoma lanceolatum TaxID=7740 RepID=A0A8K0EYD2_BRALA|nr:GHDC [Branchiostoma lanceolatum]